MTEEYRPTASIFVVDDEPSALRGVRRTLRSHGFESVLTCSDSREVLDVLDSQPISLVLLDLIMPHISGEEVLSRISQNHPDLPVIVITAEQDVRSAVRCMKLGAVDYLLKPVASEQLVATVDRALENSALRYENTRLREQFFAEQLRKPESFADIVTSDPAMLRLFAYLEAISRGSQPVLIAGETGTGKELVAQALHRAGQRKGPFVAVNVAGLDDTMFSDTLFGHRPGAFTGAGSSRRGMIDKAGEGTLFLDEIGDLAESSQVKLLRLLQEREYYPLGSDSPGQLRARVVAATHKDPSALRPDLYYRLRSYHVRIPPLRDRLGDLPALIDHFLSAAAQDLGKTPPEVPAELLVCLGRYEFPGNVRELQSMVFEGMARHREGPLPVEPFVGAMETSPREATRRTEEPEEVVFPYPLPSLQRIQEAAVGEALRRVRGDRAAAARMLDVLHLPMGSEAAPGPGEKAGEPEGLSGGRILTRGDWKRLEQDNIQAALERSGGKISGEGGAAELLGMKPTTLVSRMKSLGIEKPR